MRRVPADGPAGSRLHGSRTADIDAAIARGRQVMPRLSRSSADPSFSAVCQHSLSRTVDAVNDAVFHKRRWPAATTRSVAHWIAGRQGLPGAYADTFAGFPSERASGIVLFTGERIASASARHILGEEAARALRQLGVRDRVVTTALDRADEGLGRRLVQWTRDRGRGNPGTYCCGKCTVGLWRNLVAGGLDRQDERLQRGVEQLRASRDGKGGWRKYPFWYTVLALSEMDFKSAANELTYCEPLLRAAAARVARSGVYAARRRQLASAVLDRAFSRTSAAVTAVR